MTVNGEPVAATDGHREPLLALQLNHDGTAEVSGCVSCADPGRIAALLRQLADTVTANPQGDS